MSDSEYKLEIPSEYFPQTLIEKLENLPEDFTFYVKRKAENGLSAFLEKALDDQNKNLAEREKRKSLETHFKIRLGNKTVPGRALACLSYKEKAWSISYRVQKLPEQKDLTGDTTPLSPWKTGFTPKSDRGMYLNSISEICNQVKEEIFTEQEETESQGLLVIAGATASAKSKIARGIIDIYLQKLHEEIDKRRLHLVTFEDPVEKEFCELDNPNSEDDGELIRISSHNHNIDYTPRGKNIDVRNLKDALKDALRQTPTIFYVGETREENDWRELIRFAGSGHLVVTTTHAGSLIEAMQMIFQAMDAKTPVHRNFIANRILGVAHLKRLKKYDKTHILLPAVWRKTAKGINDLTANGMTSLLPGCEKTDSTLGRKHFAVELFEKTKSKKRSLEKYLLEKAIDLDLRGE